MKTRFFLFNNGYISEETNVLERENNKKYFKTAPRNFLELIDTLKKLSFLCDGVYVILSENTMKILFFERDSLELFTKLQLTTEDYSMDINERLKDFLCDLNNE